LQETHNNSSAISQSSSNIAETQHQVTQSRSVIYNQTLQSINNNNNKIYSNVDQQLNDPNKDDEEVLIEPNNNTNNNNTNHFINRACYRHHPVSSRRGTTEFISQQVPSFRSFGGGSNNRNITQRNK
jgi:hypothetical protein